jgi:uncharacterized protein YecE (DUF72 family)
MVFEDRGCAEAVRLPLFPQELEPWVDRVKTIAADAEETYVVTNNHNLAKLL